MIRANSFLILLSFFLIGVSFFWHPSFFSLPAFQVFIFILVLDILWVSQAMPMGIVALLPLLFFPFIGLFSLNDVIANYFSKISIVILSSSAIGLAFAKYNLHKATVFYFFSRFGSSVNGFVYSFTLASCFLSMFISNTITGVIMLPLSYVIVNAAYGKEPYFNLIKNRTILAVCFASSIGGIGTVFGSPVNFLGLALLEQYFDLSIDFTTWSLFAMPVVFALTIVLLFSLRISKKKLLQYNIKEINNQGIYKNLNFDFKTREKLVVFITIISLSLAFFSSYISSIVNFKVDYFYILLIAKILLFTIPLNKPLLLWNEDAKNFPWQVVLVMGASFSFAGAIKLSGLQDIITSYLNIFAGQFSILLILIIVLALLLLFTEISSASGALIVFFPIIALIPDIATTIKPEYLTILLVMASSLAFMLPISTIPNLLASSSYIEPKYLLRYGFMLNIASFLVLALMALFFVAIN